MVCVIKPVLFVLTTTQHIAHAETVDIIPVILVLAIKRFVKAVVLISILENYNKLVE